jgi:hypothetical protein
MKSRVVLSSSISFVVGALVVVAILIFNPFVKPARLAPAITTADATGHVVEKFTIEAPGTLSLSRTTAATSSTCDPQA